jgi:serine phosphatase RsbU (regulator of sigma subunit)
MVANESNGLIYIASVDCTGHGVPGALISIIGNSLLSDIIKNYEYDKPGDILKALHYGVVDALNQEQEGALTNDGMDIALLKIDKRTKIVEFSGAHRPLIHISSGEVKEIKGSRLSIGGTQYTSRGKKMDFTTERIPYAAGDSFHFFSDGFPDQFSEKTKGKLGGKNIREFYDQHKNIALNEMGVALQTTFDEWKGNHHQIDDVLVIGVKL